MHNIIGFALVLAVMAAGASAYASDNDPKAFLGQWELTKEGGGAGWLEVTQKDGYLDAQLLWLGGSVVPVDSVYMKDGALEVARIAKVERKDASGKVERTHSYPEIFTMKLENGKLAGQCVRPNNNGVGVSTTVFSGVPEQPMPPAPDLSKVKFGPAVNLLAKNGLDGWKLMEANAKNGWSVKDGVLFNDAAQPENGPHVSYGNLRTEKEFEDFNLKLEVKVPKDGNSGVYLRGTYEVQVEDSLGKPLDPHVMGGIYSRIAPSVSAEKPAGEWQSMDITLLDRHVTVKLNGKLIIDNQPVMGCTGGAMTSDVTKPGPLYLQGDHGTIWYRNIAISPVVK